MKNIFLILHKIFLARQYKNNITMFDNNVNEKKLKIALECSCCDDFLTRKNIDQNYYIEDFGKNFSGEKQRIQLARLHILINK